MEITVFGRGVGVIVPSTTLTVVPAIGRTWRADRDVRHPNAGPALLVAGVHGDPFAGAGQPHHDAFGQRVLGGDVHATELPRVVQRHRQPVTGVDLAQQHTRTARSECTSGAASTPRRRPCSARHRPAQVGRDRAGPAPPAASCSMTLGGAVGGWAVRTVTVAVMLPSPETA